MMPTLASNGVSARPPLQVVQPVPRFGEILNGNPQRDKDCLSYEEIKLGLRGSWDDKVYLDNKGGVHW